MNISNRKKQRMKRLRLHLSNIRCIKMTIPHQMKWLTRISQIIISSVQTLNQSHYRKLFQNPSQPNTLLPSLRLTEGSQNKQGRMTAILKHKGQEWKRSIPFLVILIMDWVAHHRKESKYHLLELKNCLVLKNQQLKPILDRVSCFLISLKKSTEKKLSVPSWISLLIINIQTKFLSSQVM